MATKRPKGMSAREWAAKQSGGKLDYKTGKITVKKSTPAKSTPAPLKGEGPLLPGQTRQSTYAGPSLPGKTQPGYYNWENHSVDYNTDKKKSSEKKDSGSRTSSVTKSTPVNTSQRSSAWDFLKNNIGIPTASAETNTSPGGKESKRIDTAHTKATGLGRFLQIAADPYGLRKGKDKSLPFGMDVTAALGLDEYLRTPQDMEGEFVGTRDQGFVQAQDPISIPSSTRENNFPAPLPAETETKFIGGGGFDNQPQVTTNEEPMSRGNKGQSDYERQLQASLKGYDSQMDDTQDFYKNQQENVGRQYEDLISGIDPMYQGYQRQAEGELGQARQSDLNRLASLFSAYNTGDSEQRMQQEERTMGDYGSKLADLLESMNLAKQKEIQGYRTNQYDTQNQLAGQGFNALQGINQAKQSAGMNVANLLQNYKQQQFENQRSMMPKSGGQAYNSQKNIAGSVQDYASNWVANQPHAYARPGGAESITRQLAAQYGGSPEQYSQHFQPGWEDAYWQQPQQSGYAPSGEVQRIMQELGVDAATAQKLILSEMQ